MPQTCWYWDPYPVDSHRNFRERYITGSRFTWQVETLPASFWRWRMRAAAAVFTNRLRDRVQPGDLILTTSMLDVSQLRGLLPVPVHVVQYFHENQLTYARDSQIKTEHATRHAHSILAADAIVFNSQFHRNSFATAMAKHQRGWEPDSQLPAVITKIAEAPVIYPCIPSPGAPQPRTDDPPIILWNHRWCQEKRPDRLLQLVDALAARNSAFRLAITGSTNEMPPDTFTLLKQRHDTRIVAWGYQDAQTYQALLHRASIVLSTSDEENFGLSVAEACGAGCMPILPQKLVYPELYGTCPTAQLYRSTKDAVAAIEASLQTPEAERMPMREALAPYAATQFSEKKTTRALDDLVLALVEPAGSG